MDAQNAAQSDQTKLVGAPPQRRGSNAPASTAIASASTSASTPLSPKLVSPVKNSKGLEPVEDSDAETIVLPGKDGHSPSKVRKVRQEDVDGDGDRPIVRSPSKPSNTNDGEKNAAALSRSSLANATKMRLAGQLDRDRHPRSKDGSSGLSSAPTSPPHNQHRRCCSVDTHSSSDSEYSQHKPNIKSPIREKNTQGERLLSHKRKASKVDSDDEADRRKVRRQRTTSAGLEPGRAHRESKTSLSARPHHDPRNRSSSPHNRPHRRSISTQLPSSSLNGLGQKKRRLPPPLQATDYHSDESSASGSPHPRGSKLRSLATPATAESNASPARMAPHKKHLDAHGQTFLARACARGEYEGAKQRLGERAEDLNVADYAGNTPLQIAAINGCEDIVKLLIDAGCNLDCVNYDKDTPLLDAVDNGHLGVVKLLLDAGVNPRKANVNGEEPIDRVSDDTENAEEIRAALIEAKKRAGERRRTSEDRHSHYEYHDLRDSYAPESPRHSPAHAMSGAGRRSGTVRSTKTRNDLLYMPLDDKTLRQAAGRGDEETVARILQVKEGYDDPEAMVAAARGGHDLVIQLLLGLGGANPDPPPVQSLPSDFATPILAAIGQENIKVVELLLEQQAFDPTRRFKGDTYYEIARKRQGSNWKEEEQLLKNAYDEYKRCHKDSAKTKSPGRREREKEREGREAKRSRREEAKTHKRSHLSPSRDAETKRKPGLSKLSDVREKHRSNYFTHQHDEQSQKRGPGRPKKEERVPSINVSDREISPALSQSRSKAKRTEAIDAAGVSSEGETTKPRRKLISKGELQRRSSMVSNAPSSPHESRHEEPLEKQRTDKLSEKYHDRTKAIKRDESKDRLSMVEGGLPKRHRTSVTPDRPSNGDKDDGDAAVKRRRLEGEGKEKRPMHLHSPDERTSKPSKVHEASTKALRKDGLRNNSDNRREAHDAHRRESGRSSGSDKSIHVKSEETDVEMLDGDPMEVDEDFSARPTRDVEDRDETKRLLEQEAQKREDERKREETEAKLKAEEETRKREQEENRKRKEDEQREAERKRREEEEKRQREAAEKARQEEEERRKLEEDAKRKKQEEEDQRRREEERLSRERQEREAAEEARRKQEEEERQERERRERAHREEMEQKRAAREAELKRLREEQERARLEKLPPLLRWLVTCSNPKLPAIAEKFRFMQGARYDTIRPEANGTAEGREQWMLNTHAALLLGEKDLSLSRYTAWERVQASDLAKLSIWRVEWKLYSLVADKVLDLGQQLPGYYGDEDPAHIPFRTREELKIKAYEKFLKTDMFFVKVSDLMYTVPSIPHLRNIELAVEYRELIESVEQSTSWSSAGKWRQDPDAHRYHGFAPRRKYYLNGAMVREDMPTVHQTSNTPFPEKRVPRRGLVQVFPDDPDYTRLCLEQGLHHLVERHQSHLPNGTHSSPISQKSVSLGQIATNGTNGFLMHRETSPGATTNGGLPNGVNGSPH